MKPILEASHIDKHFWKPVEFHVLKDINFSVNSGEFVSIMGKSGCGKSTLLYILSTMDRDYEGKLFLNGDLLTGQHPNKLAYVRNKHIGFVFQFHYLLPEFTVLENVMLPARKLGERSTEEIRKNALHKLDMLGIRKSCSEKSISNLGRRETAGCYCQGSHK